MMPAFSAGIALIIIITLFWDICVIQFNPAVTVSLVMAEILPFRLMIPNIIGIGYKSDVMSHIFIMRYYES